MERKKVSTAPASHLAGCPHTLDFPPCETQEIGRRS